MAVSLYKRRRRQDAAALLDHSLSKLFAQIAMHDRARAADYAMEHEHLPEAVQQRLDANPQAMRQRRETVERPFGTMKARMGATHFLTKTLPKVTAEMALSVLAYNLTRVMKSSAAETTRLLAIRTDSLEGRFYAAKTHLRHWRPRKHIPVNQPRVFQVPSLDGYTAAI
jgi:hypothetical protein